MPNRRRYTYLDWVLLSEPAAKIVTGEYKLLPTLTSGLDVETIRNAFARMSLEIEGIGENNWRHHYASRQAFIELSRRELMTDSAADVLGKFLRSDGQSTNTNYVVSAGLSRSGFVVAVIDCEGDTTEATLRTEQDLVESAAALLVRMIEIAATGKPSKRYIEPVNIDNKRAFEISPLSIFPLRVDDNPGDDIEDAVARALDAASLLGAKAFSSHVRMGLLENPNALVALGQRHAIAGGRAVQQIEDATTKTDGYNILTRIKRTLGFSILALAGVFFVLILLPSLNIFQRILIENFRPEPEVLVWIFTLFLIFCIEIWIAVWGLRRLFGAEEADSSGSRYNILNATTHARFLFSFPWLLPALVATFLIYSMGVFWSKAWLFDRFIELLPWQLDRVISLLPWRLDEVISRALGSLGTFLSSWLETAHLLPGFALAPPSHGTFTNILRAAVWTLPAIGIGILKYSYDEITETVLGSQENRRYQSILERLDPILAAGRLYVAQFTNIFRFSPVQHAEKEEAKQIKSQLPSFDRLGQRVDSEKSRISKSIDEAKSRFNRSAALTAVLVGALVALEPLKELKPDGRKEDVAQIVGEVYASKFTDFPKLESCKSSGDNCTQGERIAYAVVHAMRFHLDKIADGLKPPSGQPGIDASDVREAVAEALGNSDLLKSIRDSITSTLDELRKRDPSGSQSVTASIIAGAIVTALGDPRLADLQPNEGVRKTMEEAGVSALSNPHVAENLVEEIREAIQTTVDKTIRDVFAQPLASDVEIKWKNKDALLEEIRASIQAAIKTAVETAVIPGKSLALDTTINKPTPTEIDELVEAVTQAVKRAALEFSLSVNHDVTFRLEEDQFNETKELIARILADLPCDTATPCQYPAPEEIADAILTRFSEKSFPVLPALPKACRPADRLVATLYFRKAGAALSDVNCLVVEGGDPEARFVASVGSQNPEMAKDCSGANAISLSDLKARMRGSVATRWKDTKKREQAQILVVGYADSTGPVSSNIQISNGRARSAAELLRKGAGSAESLPQVSAIGRSEVAQAGEFRAGEAYESAESRRAEIRLCHPD